MKIHEHEFCDLNAFKGFPIKRALKGVHNDFTRRIQRYLQLPGKSALSAATGARDAYDPGTDRSDPPLNELGK